mmetsp:Transcript_43458/g.88908  ORF Transcript_43458/g.88908 Transcript_43458/m.88908 type:complete len:119 (-) Transcript_43458:143-499(-)
MPPYTDFMNEAKRAAEPAYTQIMRDAQPAYAQIMHEAKEGLRVAHTEILTYERGDGMWGTVVVLFFIAFILAMFYILGFFERFEAWIGVFLLFMVFVFYMEWMQSGDHYAYYRSEPYT